MVLIFLGCVPQKKVSKPNVLWLVVEDMSPYLSFYGNTFTHTPTLDSLARKSIIFDNAHSNGAQCSPARSTLISGIYAPMLGTDWHRLARPVPQEFYYPLYLKKAGFYTTNNSKTDYNDSNRPKNVWDLSKKGATYVGRTDTSKPFFSVMNYGGTHTSRIATRDTLGRSPRRIHPDSVIVPDYLPDIPEVRNDLAWHYDSVSEMDQWVKEKLEELKDSGELENTIIFFYSDHGGCLPRAKAFTYEVGTKVPLLVHFPEKFKHLANGKTTGRDDRLVGFVDFAPTIFNLLDIEIPDFMMGRPFLGKNQPKPKNTLFTYRTNQEQNYIPSRALSDGKYRLIWNFNTAYPNGARQSYQWQMPSYQGWDKAFLEKRTDSLESVFWKPMQPFEFYDTENDFYESKNLINAPEHKVKIDEMKEELLALMKQEKDLGLYPWSIRKKEDSIPFYHYVRRTDQDVEAVIDAAVLASTATINELQALIENIQSDEDAIRYWGVLGVLALYEHGQLEEIPNEITTVFEEDSETEIRLIAAELLVKGKGDKNALNFILEQVKANYFIAFSVLQNLGSHAKPIEKELLELEDNPKLKQFYIRSALINTGYYQYDDLYRDKKDINLGYQEPKS
ncbi:sulfatase-like hydrolase/transferase [Flagellimonas sp. MMG031]|uniref:Sulfatase-like hydrolase/transferase n=1 Tax=Flagellimonas sp. MMG031 TaxID=3158549 RepID=A0AAU7MX21_9FLAO